ncbi:MAG: hypothetical protein ACJ70Q_00200 [Nitrososphaera sp.]
MLYLRHYNDDEEQISEDRAAELIYEENAPGMYETVRKWAQEIGGIYL